MKTKNQQVNHKKPVFTAVFAKIFKKYIILQSKLLTDQGAICDLELIDESGQIMNIADFSPKEKGYNLLKENCTYYPVIIKKNSDGSLSNFDIYGKEVKIVIYSLN